MRLDEARRGAAFCTFLTVTAFGCTGSPTPSASPSSEAPPTVEEARKALREASEQDRTKYAQMTFEEFKASDAVYKEPFEGGKYVVDGDTTIVDDKRLREFFENRVQKAPPPPVDPRSPAALIVATVDGLDASWNDTVKTSLTYCVGRSSFGPKYDAMVADMQAAAQAWESSANVRFVHLAEEDDDCTASNGAVVFDVRAVDVGGQYLARAFFPNEPRATRNVLVDQSALDLGPGEMPQLVGILRHELGHALGYRHEHTRPSAGVCFEDDEWRELTLYDPYSVMHYPQCNGLGDWSLTLTSRDHNGSACLYGAAEGFAIDPSLVLDPSKCHVAPDAPPTGTAKTASFAQQSVALHEKKTYPALDVVAGSLFTATIGGSGASGDPDLYVRFGAAPELTSYDCRPFLWGPTETCAVNVPPDQTKAHVMVHGYEAGRYDLKVEYMAPAP